METKLTPVELRVLGCLLEKELTTPEYYPLSLNALTNACNQKSNRDPVMSLEETDVVRGLEGLRMKHMVVQSADSGRVPKYRHILAERHRLEPPELAILCELMVRGAQTVGELRTRGERMHPFQELAAVETVLAELAERNPPMVMQLPRQPGRKECRYAQLFSEVAESMAEEQLPPPEAARLRVNATDEKLARLAEEVAELRAEVAELRQAVAELKAEFE